MQASRARPYCPASPPYCRAARDSVLRAAVLALCLISLTPVPSLAEPVATFDQPALPLARALNSIGERAGISVLIKGDSAGLNAPAVQGITGLQAALDQVLAGSGAVYRFTSDGSLVVTLPAAAPVSAAENLGTIVLTASGQPQHLIDAPASVTVIPAEGLSARPMASLADALRSVPGLYVPGPGREGLPAISLRGMGQSYVLLMIDGRPLSASEEASYNGHGLNTRIGFLPPLLALDRIEVIRGPLSALHGSAAAGGVINVISRDIPGIWGGEAMLGFGRASDPASGNSHEARVWLGGPLVQGRLGLALFTSLTARQEDDRISAGYQSQGLGAARRSISGLRLRWTPVADQSLELSLQESRVNFSRSPLSARSHADTKVTDRITALSHRIGWGENRETTSFLQWEATDFRSGNESGHDALVFNTRTTLGEGRRNLTLGYEYRRERTRHDPDRLPDLANPRLHRWHHSVFLEGALPLGEDVTLTLGLRADQNQKYGFALTPRASFIWYMTPDLVLKGGIGSGYKVPALKQADDGVAEPSGGDGRSRDRGNSALRPERSTNVELGLIWTGPEGLHMGATLWHSRFYDRIARADLCRTPTGQAPGCLLDGTPYVAVSQYINDDSARLSGAELALDLTLDDWNIAASYTYSESRVTRGRNVGQRFHNLPLHMLTLSLDWQAGGRLNLWGQARARSRAPASGRQSQIPAHVIVDLGLSFELSDRVSGVLAVYNLNDRHEGDVLPEGRRLHLGLTTRF